MEEPNLLLPAPIPPARAKFPFKIIGSVFGFLILTVGLGFGLLQVQRNQQIKKSSASGTSFVTNICGKPTNTGGVTGTGCAGSCSSGDGKNGSCRDINIDRYDTFIDVQVCSGDGDHTKCDGSNGGINIANINGGGTANTSNYGNYCRVQFDFYKDDGLGSGRQLIDFLVYWDSANCGAAPTSPPQPTNPPNPTSPPQPTNPPIPTVTPVIGNCPGPCAAFNNDLNGCNSYGVPYTTCAYYMCSNGNRCAPRGSSGICPGTGPINCSALPTSTPIPTPTPTPTIIPTATPTPTSASTPTPTITPTRTPTPTMTPTPTPMTICQQIKVYRGTPLVEIVASDIQKGNSITFRAFANATNTTISTIRFTVTIGTGAATTYDRTASLVGGTYQADLQLDITQAATYTVTAQPI